jgi:hypothetical protein
MGFSMSHYIVRDEEGDYMYHRRSYRRYYEERTELGTNKSEARVFTRKSAATKSANQAHSKFKYEVIEVELVEKEA